MGLALNGAEPFEAVDEQRHGSGGEYEAVAEVALGERAVEFEVFEGIEIGQPDAEGASHRGAHPVALHPEPVQGRGDVRLLEGSHIDKDTCQTVYLVTK